MFRYDWVWDKTRGNNFQQANYAPMKSHELVLVFSHSPAIYAGTSPTMHYYPQKTGLHVVHRSGAPSKSQVLHKHNMAPLRKEQRGFFPKSIQTFPKDKDNHHKTQKPVALGEYLIRTYTCEDETVLDNTMGSGSFGVAAINMGRRFIGIEREQNYFDIAKRRIEDALTAKGVTEPIVDVKPDSGGQMRLFG
jgi:site-specific DNA-methyltransferase (adenine-specific)